MVTDRVLSDSKEDDVIALISIPMLALGIVLGSRFNGSNAKSESAVLDLDDDLPCPWCFAPTNEQDQTCPACGRRFGIPYGPERNLRV